MQPLVSFVVPAYNFGAYIGDCLSSILNQTGSGDFEVIVIDDASTDDTYTIIRSFKDQRIHCIQHAVNRGNIRTINEGLASAQGHFIARIDGDDRYKLDFLEQTLPIFQQFPKVGLVYGDVASINETGQILVNPWEGIRSRQTHQNKDFCGNEFLAQIEENVIPAATVIARREVWAHALPVPAHFAFSDWYLNLRMARQADFYYLARTLAEYRIHPQNLHSQVVHDNSVEITVVQILDQIFSEKDWHSEKQRIKRRVFAKAYLNFAGQYFEAKMFQDARRCYWKAFTYRPDYVIKAGRLRMALAVCLGPENYQSLKALVR